MIRRLRRFVEFLIVILIIIGGISTAVVSNYLGQVKKTNIDKSLINNNNNLKEYRNIAILGTDSRPNKYEDGARTDCIMIISIKEKTKEVKVISIYRDTYLRIKNVKKNIEKLDKINHAYSEGGAQNTLLALNSNLDLNIDEYIAVNFATVIDVVDAVDGVEISINEEELKELNDKIKSIKRVKTDTKNLIKKPGTYNLNGEQALAYSRIRFTTGGDYKRTERQREILKKVVSKSKNMSFSKVEYLAKKILPEINTNMSNKEILEMMSIIFKMRIIETIGWPYTNRGGEIDKVWYGTPVTLESNVIRLHKEIFNETNYKPSERVKEISNQIIKKTGYKEGSGTDTNKK